MNQNGPRQYQSCQDYCQTMQAAGYDTVLQGSGQGALAIADDGTVSMNKQCGLPSAFVSAVMNQGGSDERLSLSAILDRQSASRTWDNHAQARQRVSAIQEAISAPEDTPKGPSQG